MDINNLRKEYELIDLFCNLAEIPSPSLREDNLIKWIENYCNINDLELSLDDYNNIYIKVPCNDCNKPPLLLSAHMDVIGDDSPVKLYMEGDLIRAEGRTLGADDKAGLAQALLLAKELKNLDIKHGDLELVFTRDEEFGMTGIRNVDFSRLKSRYVLVCDADALGQLETAGASYINVHIEVNSFKGGHSGIDIADPMRENAVKLIADIVANLPQGVYYSEGNEVITSCNIGGIRGGDINVTNVINTFAEAAYSIRSSSKEYEEELKQRMINEINDFNKEYEDTAEAKISFEEHLPAFEKVEDKYIPILFETIAKKVGISADISTFHAGAETHIYANKTNSDGEKFIPYLIGLANICNMHSKEENVDYKSMLKGHEFLTSLFKAYNS